MTATTPGCGSNSEARKRAAEATNRHAGCAPGTCRAGDQWRTIGCGNAPVPVDQTILASDPIRKGNCVAACVATLLGIPLDRVPHFIEFGIAYGDSEDVAEVSHGNNWWAMMLGFLAGRGLWVVELEQFADAERDELLLVAGMSPRGVVHQVIYKADRLWHDPHPSREGVLDVREILAVRPLPGFGHSPTEPGDRP